MEKITEARTLPQLVKGSSTYKLVVPEKVERKIRYLLRKFPHTEWSGVLFVKHTGTFENNDLVVTCEDIYPMDLGNSVYTEFKMNEDVAAYMAENIELFDCDTALLHSHHQMSCQPSGTDLQTLREEGNERNCFVSLIVNNAGKYYAAITRKVQTQSEVTIKRLGTSYEFFGDGSKEIDHDGTETTKTIEKEVIEYFDLEVERHEVSNDLEYLDARFEEIERRKAKPATSRNLPETFGSFRDYLHDRKEGPREQEILFGDAPQELSKEDEDKLNEMAMAWQPDPKVIHSAVVRMVTCSFIINPDKVNFKQWIVNHMKNMYKRIFGKDSDDLSYNSHYTDAFDEYKDFIIQFTMDYMDIDDVPDVMLDNYDVLQSRVASAMMEEIHPYLEGNSYMQSYYDALMNYVIE